MTRRFQFEAASAGTNFSTSSSSLRGTAMLRLTVVLRMCFFIAHIVAHCLSCELVRLECRMFEVMVGRSLKLMGEQKDIRIAEKFSGEMHRSG